MLAAVDCADLDDGPRTGKSGAERMCAVTRVVMPVADLIRFVVAPDGTVIPDLKRKLPGRGLWVSASRGVLAEAVRRGVFARGFKREVRISPDFLDATDAALVRGIVEALAMAGKAGEVVTGFGKVEKALRSGEATALIHASDGAADGIRKLDAIVRQNAGEQGEISVLTPLTSEQLDLALGRSNVIHAALREGPAATTVLTRCQGLVRFRELPDRREAGKTPNLKTSDLKTSDLKTSDLKTSISKTSTTTTSETGFAVAGVAVTGATGEEPAVPRNAEPKDVRDRRPVDPSELPSD
jgi:predicted RNA-binding protein YlxR (DUF448 family)